MKLDGSGSDMGPFNMPDGGDAGVGTGGESMVELEPAWTDVRASTPEGEAVTRGLSGSGDV